MKKVLALVLAVMMMATVAFAATTEIAAGQKNFGEKVTIDSGDLKAANKKDVNSDNYSITSIKYNEGRNLIKSIRDRKSVV